MDKVEGIWSADVVLHRGTVDGLVTLSGEAGFTVTNDDAPVVVDDEELTRSALEWLADQLREDPADLQVVSMVWSIMPFVDAGELPPPPPG